MKKLIIFDLDGTLAHTQPLLNFVFADALTECGFPETEEHVRELVKEQGFRSTKDGGHAPVAYLDRIPDDYGIYFWSNYENYYIKAADRLYDGIRETLDELKARGHAIAVFSNKPHRFTKPIIDKAFGEGYFDFVLGGTPELFPKPDARCILYICKMLGFNPADTYMIGDLPADYLASKSAGANHIIANWGYGHEKGLRKQGATVFAEKPLDILEILK